MDKADVKKGFWLGLGLLGALIVWHLLSGVLGKVVNRG